VRSILTVLFVAGCTAALTWSIGVVPASAHHSFGRFDMAQTSEIEGSIRKFEWSNPHCWLFVSVPSSDGADVTYGFEMSSVGELLRRGWTKTALKPGDKAKITFRPLRDGSPAGLLMSATKDGQMVGQPIRGLP
jgi:Family of unknown function (DUF6152)